MYASSRLRLLAALLGCGAATLLIAPRHAAAQPADRQDAAAAQRVALYDRWERAFRSDASAAPTTRLIVQFTGPSGQTRQVDGYWDGGRTWRVRLLADQTGKWTYRTRSEPEVAGLHDQSGRFTVGDAQGTGRFAQHGPVRVAEGGRHLEHTDGTPFFFLADTVWNGALLSTDDEWQRFLDDRVAKGFTAIQFVTTQWRTVYETPEGHVAYSGRDPIELHPEFFQRIDARIDAINQRGLLAVPVVLWGLGEPEHTPGHLPTEQAARLARYIVARYGGHHVLWFLGGDTRYEQAPEHWKAIGRAAFAHGHHAPAALHPTGRAWPFEPFADQPWYTVHVYQSGHAVNEQNLRWLTSGPPAQLWRAGRPRPVINSEPPYEDHDNRAVDGLNRFTAYDVRRACYWSLLVSPTAGVTYGAHGVWSWQQEPGEPLNHRGTGVAQPWHTAMQLPGSTHMAHLAQLFQSLDWWQLRPAQDLLATQPGDDDPARFIAVGRTAAGDATVAYLPVGGQIQFRPSAADAETRGEWFDPRTGQRQAAEPVSEGRYRAPSGEDWVLVLRRGR